MASAANNAVLEADDRVLVIERVFDAPRDLVCALLHAFIFMMIVSSTPKLQSYKTMDI